MLGEIIGKSDKKHDKSLYVRCDGFPSCNAVAISIYYEIGGYNYFTSQQQERGYYLSIQPLEKHGSTTMYTFFTGKKLFLQPAKRFNARILNELADKYLSTDSNVVKGMVISVVNMWADKNPSMLGAWKDYIQEFDGESFKLFKLSLINHNIPHSKY